MRELQKRMQRMLFTILSLFIGSIAFLYNFQAYADADALVHKSVLGAAGFMRNELHTRPDGPAAGEDEPFAVVLGLPVCTVILDSDQQPVYGIVHDFSDEDQADFLEAAAKITKQAKPGDQKIGNLYLGGYIWDWGSQYTLTIADIDSLALKLWWTLAKTLAAVSVAELVLWFLCRWLSARMISPIEETFEKQKQFVQDASHELKTPLAIIMASADAMESDPQAKWLNNIKAESERMNTLITAMLNLSRSEDAAVHFEPLDLSKTVEQAVLPYEGLLFEHHVCLDLEIQPRIELSGNKEEIVQLTGILLDNALRHAQADTAVVVRVYENRDGIFLQVENAGEPIPAGEEEKIFARFYRADSARNRQEGRYGLGLAIAKNIADRHRAKISARSADGRTTFTVQFPVLRTIAFGGRKQK